MSARNASKRNQQRKRVQQLSTNNKQFTSGGRIFASSKQDLVISSTIADDDVRLEKVRNSHHAARKATQYAARNERVCGDILEESRNGYSITAKAPRDTDAAIKHYIDMLRRYTLDFPEEWALCHFSLGKVFAADYRPSEDRSRQVENGLFHFKTASQVFTAESFPAMWAISSLMQASLYREKSTLICTREYNAAKRLNAFPTTQVGIEMAEETLSHLVFQPHRLVMEHAFCRLIMGWLLWQCGDLNSDNITTFSYTQLLERSIAHLEKGISLFEKLYEAEEAAKGHKQLQWGDQTSSPGIKTQWSNLASVTADGGEDGDLPMGRRVGSEGSGSVDFSVPFHPHHHKRVLLAKKPLIHYIGICYSLLGQAYYGLCTEGDASASKDTLQMAYENLTNSLKLKYGLKDTPFWVEARFLLASIVLKDPLVLDDSTSPTGLLDAARESWQASGTAGPSGLAPIDMSAEKRKKKTNKMAPANAPLPIPPDNNVAIEVALSHLTLASHSPACRKNLLTEIYFFSGIAHFAKLHFLSDTVVSPAAFATPLSDGSLPADVMTSAEEAFQQAVKRVSAMGKGGIEAYIYFFSSLKIAELKVLQAVAINYHAMENADGTKSLRRLNSISHVNDIQTKSDRDYFFQSALKYLLDALQARQPFENVDLHFLSSAQMGYLLSIGPKRELSVHCFVRAVMCLSCIIIRSRFFDLPKSIETVSDSNNLGFRRKRHKGASDFYAARQREHRSLDQMADEARRLTSMALLSSLKLVTWLKPSRMGEAKRGGTSIWSFEKFGAMSTRFEALTGKTYQAAMGLLPRSETSVVDRESVTGGVSRTSSRLPTTRGDLQSLVGMETSDMQYIHRSPTKPLDPPPLRGTTKNRLDTDTESDLKNAQPKSATSTSSLSRSDLGDRKMSKKIVEVEIEVEESLLIKSQTSFIRPRGNQRDAKGQLLNEEEVPIAPSHIKAPPKEYKDVKVTTKVKKKVQREIEYCRQQSSAASSPPSVRHQVSITALNREVGSLKHSDIASQSSSLPKYKKRVTFFDRLAAFFSEAHRAKVQKRMLKLATAAATNATNAPKIISSKMKESIAATEVRRVSTIEVIGTEHCVFGLMALIHLSRQLLMLKCLGLEVGRGARARYLLGHYMADELAIKEIRDLHLEIRGLCELVEPCPWTLQELSESCTHKELRRIFRSQQRISQALLREEVTINKKFAKLDPFLPMVLTLPAYHRVAAEDSTDNEFNLDEERILLANNVVKDPVAELVQAEPRARRQAKFGRKNGQAAQAAHAAPVVDPKLSFTPLGVPSGGNIGMNGVAIREGRRQWASYLDSTYKGIDRFCKEHLQPNEAMVNWHMFTSALTALGANSYPLQAILAWKDTVEDVKPYVAAGVGVASSEVLSLKAFAAAEKYKAAVNNPDDDPEDFKDEDLFEVVLIEKVFTEYCRSDVDLNQINYALQSFIDAVHSRPAPIRASKCSGALSLLSDCFAMTELLSKLPAHVDTLVICCPSYLNIVPWHLLHIEEFQPPVNGADVFGRDRLRSYDVGVGGNVTEDLPEVRTMHVMERYTVRMGSTIPMMEISSNQSVRLSHRPGLHKLCFVDTDHDATIPLSEAESGSVRSLWSSDHWDYSLLHGTWASASAFATNLTSKRDVVNSKPLQSPGVSTSNSSPAGEAKRPASSSGRRGNKTRRGAGTDNDEDEDSVDREEASGRLRTSQYLAGCRVLHLSALWKVEPIHPKTSAYLSSNERAVKECPSIALPPEPTETHQTDDDSKFDARAIVSQLYLKNCALVVLSRMGVLDNLHSKHLSLTAAEGGVLKDAAWNIIEAFQLAGACSVVCPLWGGGSTGGDLGQLARLLLLMRFYFELPNFAHTGRPVASALQQTQNWLRNASIDDVLEFLQNAPIPEKCCEELYVEVSSFKKAKSKASAGGSSLPTHHDDGGAVKLFGHFFYWGMLIAVGDCRNVHPAGVGGSMDEGIDRNKRGVRRPVGGATSLRPQQQVEECEEDDDVVGLYAGVGVEDDDEEGGDELQQMVREMQFLRMEGSHREADIMEKEIRRRRQMQMDRVKSRLQDAGQLLFSTGQRVARRTSSAFQQGSSTLSQSAQSYTQRTAAAAAHARRGKKAASGNIYEDPVYEDYHEPQDLLGIAGEGEADGDGRLGGGKRPVGEYSHKSSHGESDEEDLGQNDSHAQSAVCSLM